MKWRAVGSRCRPPECFPSGGANGRSRDRCGRPRGEPQRFAEMCGSVLPSAFHRSFTTLRAGNRQRRSETFSWIDPARSIAASH